MAYSLGPVKPHVKAAAEEVGNKFNVSRIYGFGQRPGNSTSDHPLGLALDYVSSGSQGDAIASYVQANYQRLSVKYIIWEQRVWYPGKQWAHMADRGSISANHFDHVHVSFNATPGTGGAVIDQAGFDITDPLGAINGFIESMKGISSFFAWITKAENWIRIAGVVGGATLIMIAIVSWDKVSKTASDATRSATNTAIKTAKGAVTNA